jgi:hypothetical protein
MVKKKIKKKIRDDLFSFYVSVALFVVFLGLWIFTADYVSIVPEPEPVPFDELPVSAQIDVVKENIRALEDESYFSNALAFDNPFYCNSISDSNLRRDCLSKVQGEYEEPVPDTRTVSDLNDETFYSNAIVFENPDFCNSISSVDLKQECLGLFN